MTQDHEAWLKLNVEKPIEPELPVCDAHHHLWPDNERRKHYLLDDFFRDSQGNNVLKTVFLQCEAAYRTEGPAEMKPIGETEFIDGLAIAAGKQKPEMQVAAGIVGFVDISSGEAIIPVVEAHFKASPRFRGVRQSATWDENPAIVSLAPKGLMSDVKFQEGFSLLKKYNLTFDAWQYFTQLPELASLAKTFPDTKIIVNHLGGLLGIGKYAGSHDEVVRDWQRSITGLAACPNVYMKLSGLGMPRCGFGWHERATPPTSSELSKAFTPYFSFCIQKFGVERCMFASNFPLDRESYSYTVLWNAFKLFSKDFSKSERGELFYNTATRVYRI